MEFEPQHPSSSHCVSSGLQFNEKVYYFALEFLNLFLFRHIVEHNHFAFYACLGTLMSELVDEAMIPPEKRARHDNIEENQDILSELPDCLLLHILSFLNFKYADQMETYSHPYIVFFGRRDMIRNDTIRERERESWVEPIVETMVENRLTWFEHVERRLVNAVVRRVDQMKESQIRRGREHRKTMRETILI